MEKLVSGGGRQCRRAMRVMASWAPTLATQPGLGILNVDPA